MIRCDFCQTAHINNTVFCSECGHYLLKEEKTKTTPIELEDLAPAENSIADSAPSFQQNGSPKTIRLKIAGDHNRMVEMPLNKINFIGRVDASLTVFPELDVSEEGAQAKSVSRRHASIFKEGNDIIIKDLGSINGTFINGKRLAPYLPGKLKDGDVVRLGVLEIKVHIPAT